MVLETLMRPLSVGEKITFFINNLPYTLSKTKKDILLNLLYNTGYPNSSPLKIGNAPTREVYDIGNVDVYGNNKHRMNSSQETLPGNPNIGLYPTNVAVTTFDYNNAEKNALPIVNVLKGESVGTYFSIDAAMKYLNENKDILITKEDMWLYIINKLSKGRLSFLPESKSSLTDEQGNLSQFGEKVLAKVLKTSLLDQAGVDGGFIEIYLNGAQFLKVKNEVLFILPILDRNNQLVRVEMSLRDEDSEVEYKIIPEELSGAVNEKTRYFQIL